MFYYSTPSSQYLISISASEGERLCHPSQACGPGYFPNDVSPGFYTRRDAACRPRPLRASRTLYLPSRYGSPYLAVRPSHRPSDVYRYRYPLSVLWTLDCEVLLPGWQVSTWRSPQSHLSLDSNPHPATTLVSVLSLLLPSKVTTACASTFYHCLAPQAVFVEPDHDSLLSSSSSLNLFHPRMSLCQHDDSPFQLGESVTVS
ncbi:hypothetical protein GGR56DRAFT_560254 [Xylariaceae sp. FL0804]|nr:hypothetical protein GGR56DRAFT_560254 [Xylariaceae sp. FL0804]